ATADAEPEHLAIGHGPHRRSRPRRRLSGHRHPSDDRAARRALHRQPRRSGDRRRRRAGDAGREPCRGGRGGDRGLRRSGAGRGARAVPDPGDRLGRSGHAHRLHA
ncbi:MAG: Hydantoin racemase, partial [uncultured Acetobacteraceae bacterium]